MTQTPATTPPLIAGVSMMQPNLINGQMEKLLLEAQRESRASSFSGSSQQDSTTSSRARFV